MKKRAFHFPLKSGLFLFTAVVLFGMLFGGGHSAEKPQLDFPESCTSIMAGKKTTTHGTGVTSPHLGREKQPLPTDRSSLPTAATVITGNGLKLFPIKHFPKEPKPKCTGANFIRKLLGICAESLCRERYLKSRKHMPI